MSSVPLQPSSIDDTSSEESEAEMSGSSEHSHSGTPRPTTDPPQTTGSANEHKILADCISEGSSDSKSVESSARIKEMKLKAYIESMKIDDCADGTTPLHLASKNGLLEAVKRLIEEFGFSPNMRDTNYSEIPLHYACRYGHAKIVEYFIEEQGCDAKVKDMNNLTPLHFACRHGHLDVAKYLTAKQSCNLKAKDNQQQTPLHYACHFGHIDIVKFLVGVKGCSAEIRDEEMRTPLHFACRFRHSEIVHYLVHEQKCDPNAEDCKKRTPLHYACLWWWHVRYDVDMNVSHRVAEALLTDPRCDINKPTKDGETALHLACKVDRLDIVRHLLSKPNCNLNVRNTVGQTPLQLTSHLNIISELIDRGANPMLSIMHKWQKNDVRIPCLKSWSAEQIRELAQSVKTPPVSYTHLTLPTNREV